MPQLLDPILMAILVLNFFVLGASRLRAAVRMAGLQGALVGALPLLVAHGDEFGLRSLLLSAGVAALKGGVIPAVILYAMREVSVQHETRPIAGFILSVLLGGVGTALAILFAHSLPLFTEAAGSLLVPASLSTVFVGFLILITRTLAINQVVGYLILENGIFAFSMLLLGTMPFPVEVGVLLDLFTGVFVMGIIIHHIHRDFASPDGEYLSQLKE